MPNSIKVNHVNRQEGQQTEAIIPLWWFTDFKQHHLHRNVCCGFNISENKGIITFFLEIKFITSYFIAKSELCPNICKEGISSVCRNDRESRVKQS